MTRPPVAVAGFGFRQGATLTSLRQALQLACAALPGAPAPRLLATVQDKASAACLQALADSLRLPVQGVAPARLAAMPTRTDSPAVRARRGTGSVAEAAALAAAGAGATLHPRAVSPDRLASCALAILDPSATLIP